MEFKLTYHGTIKSSGNKSNKAKNKHQIRTVFHKQLAELWKRHPTLNGRLDRTHVSLEDAWAPDLVTAYNLESTAQRMPYRDLLGERFKEHNITWLPLVAQDMKLQCSVDILFLRSGDPGSIMREGDLDGRLKTIFDSLCIPRSSSGIDTSVNPNPMFCVLEDDSQISRVSVESDELLERSETKITNEARLVLSVRIKPAVANLATIEWA